jgi:exodeoxyribonuclease VII large subunit
MIRSASRPEPDDVLSVAELTRRLKATLEGSFEHVAVAGEIADFTRSSAGHVYFTLKDDESQIRVTFWRFAAQRLKFELHDGLAVVCRGSIQLYPPRGTYQLNVVALEPVGIGAQQLAFQQLHKKLSSEGLFDPGRKRSLEKFPRRIGIVTSPTGAAIHDILQVIHRRWRDVELLVFPAQVQGDAAPPQIVAAIRAADRIQPPVETLIVARGGGSQDDIACFNDERVVRAVFACKTPVVSAVGHEVDVTLCDLVADVRALTPSHAGELAVPDGEALDRQLRLWSARLRGSLLRRAELAAQRLDAAARHPALRRPLDRVRLLRQTCDTCGQRIARGIINAGRTARTKSGELAARLQAMSPIQVLARGYSVTLDAQHRAVTRYQQVAEGERITTQLAEGRLESRVERRWRDS